jgi:hypothetical protein
VLAPPGSRRAGSSYPPTVSERDLQRLLFAAILAAVVAVCAPGAAGGFATGFKDQETFLSSDAAVRGKWLDRTRKAGARFVHLGMAWPLMVGDSAPADPADPSDPAYRNFHPYDAAIRDAQDRGLEVILALGSAPAWAEGGGRPRAAPLGTWQPDARAYGAFAQAVATRYSGTYASLPRVRFFQAWSEPNLSTYLNPQYRRGKPRSPVIYRRMLNAFYDGVHEAQDNARVITGGTAPYGRRGRGGRMPPLIFWRNVLCLRPSLLAKQDCGTRARFDVMAHHPIDTSGGPGGMPAGRNNVSTANFRLIRRTLRAAERRNTVARGARRPIWATEIWWESNPPDRSGGVGPRKHARWLGNAVRSLRRQGANVVLNYLIRDRRTTHANRFDTTASGIFFRGGRRKPAFRAWSRVSR